MATVEVEVRVAVDGLPVAGFPVVRRLTVGEVQAFDYAKADDNGTFATLPVDQIASLKALVVRPAAVMTVRLDAQTDAGIVLDADGLLVILGATIDASATTNAKISNDSGATAQVRGLAAGD